MGEHLVAGLVASVAAGAVGVLCYAGYMRWWTPERRRADAWRWAQRHLASYDERWLEPVEQQMAINLRSDFVSVFVLSSVLMQMPTSGKAYAACLVALPTLMAVVRGLAFGRVPLAPGTRVARLRELELDDYLPKRGRQLMWVSAVAGCVTCVVLAVVRGHVVVGISGALLLLAPVCVELAGRQLARMPQPAENAAHLYVQDAFRSDLVRSAALRSALGAASLCLLVPWNLEFTDQGWAPAVLLGVGVLLYVALFIEGRDFRHRPARYVRSRLWPTLASDQVLRSGDALPTRAAS